MPTKDTVYKEPNKLSKSIGAGMKSLAGGKGRKYFVLEHKNTSDNFHAGEHQEIIIDYVELGRSSECQVSFGNAFPTVSRRHAAITLEGNSWTLKQLSTTNPTLINGKPIQNQFYLQNGDEIQLSMEGPRLAFLVPNNNSVKSINFTRRLNLFRKQALRPYKQAITALSVFLVLGLGAMGYFLLNLNKDNEALSDVVEAQRQELAGMLENAERVEGNIDSLQQVIQASASSQARLKSKIRNLERTVRERPVPPPPAPTNPGSSPAATVSLDPIFPSVYFITVEKIEISMGQESEEVTDYSWTGTGFLLGNGKFITARHVAQSWLFFKEGEDAAITLNIIASNGGNVVAYFKAYSPDGSVLRFKSSDFSSTQSTDETLSTTDNDGNTFILRKAKLDRTDWAVLQTDKTGQIRTNANLSDELPQQEKLHILGYPYGLGASDQRVSPIYGNATVSSSGLESGVIMVTDRNFEPGNSGGPAFVLRNNQYEAIGIISAGTGTAIGFIVPIKEVR